MRWLRQDPAQCAASADGDARVIAAVKQAAGWAKLRWRETNYLLLERGPYVIAAGLDESISGEPRLLRGKFVNLFDAELRVRNTVEIQPGRRYLLRDLRQAKGKEPQVLASAGKALVTERKAATLTLAVEGVARTPGVLLLHAPRAPLAIVLEGATVKDFSYSDADQLLWIRFENEARPRSLEVRF